MKGFIKVTNLTNNEIFLNVDYIVFFRDILGTHTEIYYTDKVSEIERYTTSKTTQEICDMIEIARS